MIVTEAAAKRKGCYRRDTRCQGSDCMAWRWKNQTKKLGYCGAAGPAEFDQVIGIDLSYYESIT